MISILYVLHLISVVSLTAASRLPEPGGEVVRHRVLRCTVCVLVIAPGVQCSAILFQNYAAGKHIY